MRARRRRDGESGSAVLEALAGIGLMVLVLAGAWQSVVWLQQRGEAEVDARTLARVAVICPRALETPRLSMVDPMPGAVAVVANGNDTVTVTVSLEAAVVLPGVRELPAPTASATMHLEPC